MPRVKYSAEFKTKIVLEVLRGERELEVIAAENSVSPNMVRNWKSEFLAKASMVFENPAKAERQAKRKEAAAAKAQDKLLKKIGILTVERDFLQDCFRQEGIPIPELDPDQLQ